MRKIFLILLLGGIFLGSMSAQGWIQYYPDYLTAADGSYHSLSTLDNQFFIAGKIIGSSISKSFSTTGYF